MKLLEAANAIKDQILEARPYLHQNPEIGFYLPETAAYVQKRLKEMGIEVEFYESKGTAHEWLTWRRCFKEFIPHLFK